MRYCRDKQINKLVADLVQEGWQFSRGKHGKLRNPSGIGFVTIPCTPSDYRTFHNLCRDIRKQASANRSKIIIPNKSRHHEYQLSGDELIGVDVSFGSVSDSRRSAKSSLSACFRS